MVKRRKKLRLLVPKYNSVTIVGVTGCDSLGAVEMAVPTVVELTKQNRNKFS